MEKEILSKNEIMYYNQIKEELLDNEIYKRVKDYSKNKSDLKHYYNVGKLLIEAQGGESRAKYGNGLIKEYSIKLTSELGKGYSERTLKYMRKYYLFQKGHALDAQLTWNHYKLLMPINDVNKINYYTNMSIKNNLSYRQLQERIKSKEYERLPESTKNKLITKQETNIIDFIKDPIIIKNVDNKEIIKEKALHKLIVDNILDFMHQLGEGYAFIDSEYKIKIGSNNNYIDLLLFNIIYNCYIVVELKVCELKKEHIGQIQTYMGYIDDNLKTINHNKTIGIIICKQNNKYIVKYSSNPNIISREYILN